LDIKKPAQVWVLNELLKLSIRLTD
jgi:hypothetical protein